MGNEAGPAAVKASKDLRPRVWRRRVVEEEKNAYSMMGLVENRKWGSQRVYMVKGDELGHFWGYSADHPQNGAVECTLRRSPIATVTI